MKFLTAAQFGQAMGHCERVARKHFAKGFYLGEPLPVVQMPAQRGGKGGAVWVLRLDACSAELRAKLEAPADAFETPVEAPFKGSLQAWQFEEQADRLRIIQPILATTKHSSERAEAFRVEAAKLHQINGQLCYRTEKTLREWVSLYEARGQAALLPSQRADRGKRRVLVTRAWDQGIDLPTCRKASVAEDVDRVARSMIATDGTSGREVIRLSEISLLRLSVKAGSQLPKAQLARICSLNQKWVARFDKYRLAHMKAKDHKIWHDRAVPRIRRGLHPEPMGLLIGDVHYVDMVVQSHKDPIRVRLIAWMDAASHFAWVTPV